jgi:transcriptional regulator with XRE-family HTH domain
MRDEDIYRAIGRRLRARRRSLAMTQREVAVSCGLTFQQIQKYEAGLVAMPVARLITLAEVLQCPLPELVDGVHKAPGFRANESASAFVNA